MDFTSYAVGTHQLDNVGTEVCGRSFNGLKAVYINCTLTKSPEVSHTQGLMDTSSRLMRDHGVHVDNSSVTRMLIERLYAMSGETNDKGQYVFYGKVGGAIITGNEDGVKHSAMSILYSLQHIGYVITPAADAGVCNSRAAWDDGKRFGLNANPARGHIVAAVGTLA